MKPNKTGPIGTECANKPIILSCDLRHLGRQVNAERAFCMGSRGKCWKATSVPYFENIIIPLPPAINSYQSWHGVAFSPPPPMEMIDNCITGSNSTRTAFPISVYYPTQREAIPVEFLFISITKLLKRHGAPVTRVGGGQQIGTGLILDWWSFLTLLTTKVQSGEGGGTTWISTANLK